MQIRLFTGKGGVGKTSLAAATAVLAAEAGLRTLVLSTDPAHSLGDVLGAELGDRPTTVAPRLEAEQIDSQRRLQEGWADIQGYLVALLSWGGVSEIQAEELAVLPGLEEIFALLDVREHAAAGRHDLLVVDCAPTAETLRLLSLPDALGWYMQRVFPVERKVARVIRPVLGRMTSMPLPADSVLGSVEGIAAGLAEVRALLADPDRTAVRLVLNPEKVVVAEARRTYTYLSLFGYHVDAVLVNRVLPAEVADPWFDRWKAAQREQLRAIEEGFAGVPVLRAPLLPEEPLGPPALARLGRLLYGDHPPHAVLRGGDTVQFSRTTTGYELCLTLPFVDKAAVDLFQHGDELYVAVGSHTRSLVLPAALRRCAVTGATLAQGRLQIQFSPGTAADGEPVAASS